MFFRNFKTFFALFRRISKSTAPENFLLLNIFFKDDYIHQYRLIRGFRYEKYFFLNFYLEKFDLTKIIWKNFIAKCRENYQVFFNFLKISQKRHTISQ